jgi:hypothetical protein
MKGQGDGGLGERIVLLFFMCQRGVYYVPEANASICMHCMCPYALYLQRAYYLL